MINFSRFAEILENNGVGVTGWDAQALGAGRWRRRARRGLLAELKQKFPGAFLKMSEELSSRLQGGIWIKGKDMDADDQFRKIIEKYGFRLEPHDPETWFAWPADAS